MASYAERVAETTETAGSGALTLDGARLGFQIFNAAFGVGATNYFYYIIEAVDGSNLPTGDWEYGIGHLTTTTNFVRDNILSSSNAGAAVVFASTVTKNVFCPAPNLPLLTRVHRSGDQTITTATWSYVSWDVKDQDDVGAWNNGSQTRLTVPTGFTRVRI